MMAPVVYLPLSEIGLTEKVREKLEGHGMTTALSVVEYVSEFNRLTRRPFGMERLRNIKGIGKNRLQDIDEAFVQVGIDLSR